MTVERVFVCRNCRDVCIALGRGWCRVFCSDECRAEYRVPADTGRNEP